jgi:hypothetical protein
LDHDEDEQLVENEPLVVYKTLPCGYSVKRFTDAYKEQSATEVKIRSYPVPEGFEALRSTVDEWANSRERIEKANRVLRSVVDLETQATAIAASYMPVVPASLPTGQAAQTAYADFVRITAFMQSENFAQLVRPENINAIAQNVTPKNSTPLFSAFLAFMRMPPPALEPAQKSKAMFVDLVRRAVLANNQAYKWEDFVAPTAAIPVASAMPFAEAKPVKNEDGFGIPPGAIP